MPDTQNFWKKFYGTPDAVRTKRRQMRQVKMVDGNFYYGEEAAQIRRVEEARNGHPSHDNCGGLILGKVCEKCGDEVQP